MTPVPHPPIAPRAPLERYADADPGRGDTMRDDASWLPSENEVHIPTPAPRARAARGRTEQRSSRFRPCCDGAIMGVRGHDQDRPNRKNEHFASGPPTRMSHAHTCTLSKPPSLFASQTKTKTRTMRAGGYGASSYALAACAVPPSLIASRDVCLVHETQHLPGRGLRHCK